MHIYRKDGVSFVHADLQLFLLWVISKEGLRSRVYKRNKEGQSQGRAGAAVFVALTAMIIEEGRLPTSAQAAPGPCPGRWGTGVADSSSLFMKAAGRAKLVES